MLLRASDNDVEEVILGMAHRGRLNVLTNILFKPYEEVFREFVNSYDPDSLIGAGDVKYHNGYLADVLLANKKKMRVVITSYSIHYTKLYDVLGICPERNQQDLHPLVRQKSG